MQSISLHNDEVTSVCLNDAQDTLVAGFKDGLVKVFNIDKDFECREQNLVFSAMGNKKGSVA